MVLLSVSALLLLPPQVVEAFPAMGSMSYAVSLLFGVIYEFPYMFQYCFTLLQMANAMLFPPYLTQLATKEAQCKPSVLNKGNIQI